MTESFTITDSAARRIIHLLGMEQPNSKLRISVVGGGCSGFKYKYEFVTDTSAEDVEIMKDGAVVVIDEISLNNFMSSSVLDYVETLGDSYFEIKNPNSTARCGCGNSFAV